MLREDLLLVSARSPLRVLFVCTGNSARSILAEALLRQRGRGRFDAFSAGSRPKGSVHPMALQVLERAGVATADLRSKSWDEFAREGVPPMDHVITVCGNAAAEPCPRYPGRPATAHWPIEDPAAVEGDERARSQAFDRAFDEIASRVEALVASVTGEG